MDINTHTHTHTHTHHPSIHLLLVLHDDHEGTGDAGQIRQKSTTLEVWLGRNAGGYEVLAG